MRAVPEIHVISIEILLALHSTWKLSQIHNLENESTIIDSKYTFSKAGIKLPINIQWCSTHYNISYLISEY